MTTLKSYPIYKHSGIEWLDELPEQWGVRRIKHVCRFQYGDPLPSESRDHGEVPVYGSNGRVGAHSIANTLSPALVVGRKGSFGKVNYSTDPVFAIDTTFYIDERYTNSHLRWLYYLLTHVRLDSVSKDSAIPGLDRNDAYEQIVPVPPLDEQRAIADFLDAMDARITRFIAARRKMIALLEEKKQAVINQAVTRGLDPSVPMKDSGVDWLGETPAHWSVRRLRSLSEFITSGSRDWAQYYADDGSVFLRIGNLSTKSIDLKLSDLQHVRPPQGAEGERTRVLPDDILVSITAQMGAVGLVPHGLGTAYINQHTALVRLRRRAALPRFVAYFLLSDMGKQQSHMATNGGTKLGLGLDDVASLLILCPSHSEQVAIVEHIDDETSRIDTLVARHRREIELMQEYRTRLISDVVTGKLDVRGVELPAVEEVIGEEIEAAMDEQDEESPLPV